MRSFADLPITAKLRFIIMFSATTVLFITMAVNIFNEMSSFRRTALEHLFTLAQVIGKNSTAAITFNDEDVAKKVLTALAAEEDIVGASIYLSDGTRLAQFQRHRRDETNLENLSEEYARWLAGIPESHSSAHYFSGKRLDISAPITLDKDIIGHIQITSSLNRLADKIRNYLIAMALITCVTMLFVYLLSFWLQKLISKPILKLVDTMQEVSSHQDYSLKVTKAGNDEIGSLIDGFNEMLAQINERDKHLETHRQDLERQVLVRTKELSESNSELKAAIAESIRARKAAEASSRAKSQFLANMSHEIRTPMNGVLGMTELLIDTELSERQQHFAKTIYGSAESLLSIINDILDFSKIEAGKLELETVNFDLRETMENAVALMAERAQAKEIELITDIAPQIHTAVYGDPIRLGQILNNLIGNAVKFTNQGEVLARMTVLDDTDKKLHLRFEIKDTGIGLSPQDQNKVFDSFRQADNSTTREFGGTGLGLAISKQLAELMGGEIGVQSQLGEGSTFWFTVSLIKNTDKTMASSNAANALAGRRILVIDDNPTNREILQQQLTAWGVACETAKDGLQGLELLRGSTPDKPYDLVILDYHMPHMDGVDVARVIQADTALNELPRVMLSSVYHKEGLMQPGSLGIACYLNKPIRRDQLFSSLNKVLHKTMSAKPDTPRVNASESSLKKRLAGHVLLAEDNPVNQQVARDMLEIQGLQVSIASSGREALNAFSQNKYDLVLMDCHMPEMDGFEATKAIRSKERDSGTEKVTPVIALTADAIKGNREQCFSVGMNDFITKPFTRIQLFSTLKKWLPESTTESTGVESITEILDTIDDASAGQPEQYSSERVLLKKAALDNIRALQRPGKPDILQKVVTQYVEYSPKLLVQIHNAISENESEPLYMAAHSLKSASANLGAVELAGFCAELERMGREHLFGNAGELLQRIEFQYRAVVDELNRLVELKRA